MRSILVIFALLLASSSWAASFDEAAAEASAKVKAQKIVSNAEKRCTANRRIYTACLKNLQLQAIEKKIGILEKTYGLVHKKAAEGAGKTAMLKNLQKQIAYETQFLDFYQDRAFDGMPALELDLKHLLVKQARLNHLMQRQPAHTIK